MRKELLAGGIFRAAAIAHHRQRHLEPIKPGREVAASALAPLVVLAAGLSALVFATSAPIHFAARSRVVACSERRLEATLESPVSTAALVGVRACVGPTPQRCAAPLAGATAGSRSVLLRFDSAASCSLRAGDELTIDLQTNVGRLLTPRFPGSS